MMFKAILLLGVVLLGTTQTVGGYQPYTDLSSSDFQNVLAFIYAAYPSVSSYQPTAVQRQLVNGFNYKITLQNGAGCTAQATVYATFQNVLTISSFSQPPCPTTSLNAITTTTQTVAAPSPILAGAYSVQSNPSGATFQSALQKALAQNTAYLRSDLVLIETQVVAGTNYRFTFRNKDGSLTQVVIYVPLGGFIVLTPDSSQTGPVFAPPPLVGGGWSEVTDLSAALGALNAIYQQNPEVKNFYVSGVESQVVAGTNFRVGLQNDSEDSIQYALFTVYVDLQQVAHVTQVARISVSGYTVSQLIQNYNTSLQLHAELNGAALTEIRNIWQKDGLSFLFSKGGKQYKVFIYTNKGKVLNLIY